MAFLKPKCMSCEELLTETTCFVCVILQCLEGELEVCWKCWEQNLDRCYQHRIKFLTNQADFRNMQSEIFLHAEIARYAISKLKPEFETIRNILQETMDYFEELADSFNDQLDAPLCQDDLKKILEKSFELTNIYLEVAIQMKEEPIVEIDEDCLMEKIRMLGYPIEKQQENLDEVEQAETNWSHLPNEMQAMIIKHMDFRTCVQLRQCARHESIMVETFKNKCPATLSLKSVWSVDEPLTRVVIQLGDRYLEPQMIWNAFLIDRESTRVDQEISENNFSSVVEHKPAAEIISNICRRILKDPMFAIEQAIFDLGDFYGHLNFQLPNLERVVVNGSIRNMPFASMFKNKKRLPRTLLESYRVKKMDGVPYSKMTERQIALMERVTGAFHLAFSFPMCEGRVITSFEQGKEQVLQFVSGVRPFDELIRRENIIEEITSEWPVHTLMYFRNAYLYPYPVPVRFLRDADPENYSAKISFWREGINKSYFHETQVAFCSIVFLCQFLQSVPEIISTSPEFHDLLQLCLNLEDSESDQYENFVTKVEKVVRDWQRLY